MEESKKPEPQPVTYSTKFSCTMCGKCCFVSQKAFKEVFEKFGWKTKEDGSCIHLTSDKKCSIYGKRPLICRLYPFQLNPKDLEQGTVELHADKLFIDPNAIGFGQGDFVVGNPAIDAMLIDIGKRVEAAMAKGKKNVLEIFYGFPEE